jgi:hypothetical protein
MSPELIPLRIPFHPNPSIESIFKWSRENFYFNIQSALTNKLHQLVCNRHDKYLRPNFGIKEFEFSLLEKNKFVLIRWLILFNCYPEKTPVDVWHDTDKVASKWKVGFRNTVTNDYHPDNLYWILRSDYQLIRRTFSTPNKHRPEAITTLERDEYEIYVDSDIFKHMAVRYNIPDIANIRVTNKGKVRRKKYYSRGYVKYRYYPDYNEETIRLPFNRYRKIKINCKEFYVHNLIIMAKLNSEIPAGFEVFHDTDIPDDERLNEDGTERNWIQDLKLRKKKVTHQELN